MPLNRIFPSLLLAVSLGACTLARQSIGTVSASSTHRGTARSTAWPAPAGNLATCGTSGPTGDTPTPRAPADSLVRIKSKTLRQVLGTLCSFSIPVPKPITQ
jgi:hypothetical protein